ncbi:MAG TPA: lamin tail domain-containing protein, partial [Verrucomicrobiae bacterium]
RAWAASEQRGGSPGELDPTVPAPQTSVVINEFLAHTDDPVFDFVELYNRSNTRVDLSGCVLTDDPTTNRFRIPDGTFIEARGFLAWDQNQLGFALDAAGETIFLISADNARVLDAIRFGGQQNGVSSGRSPDGADTIRRLTTPTPGAANAKWRIEDIVINELMFNPITHDDNDEYVELHNRSDAAVDLGGWRFVEGIDFTIPDGTTLSPGGFLVVAKNVARLLSNYTNLNTANTVGNYGGVLRNSGERLALAKPDWVVSTNNSGVVTTNRIFIVVSEVTYSDGGRWGLYADGGGSSLELIDPRGDLLRPSDWADSDETAKAPWTTVEFTGTVDNANGTANRLRIGSLGGGECLVDDVEVFRTGFANVLTNGTFEAGAAGWLFSGNHSTSSVQNTGAASGTYCLRLRAQGDGDTGPNSIRTTLSSTIPNGATTTIRAKVRWLAGWPQVLFRLHGNGLELAANMTVPRNLGTPGLPNSRRVANAGPAIYDVKHEPAVPAANEQVRVTCRFSDTDGLSLVRVRYRVDPSSTLSNITMRDDGTQGDEVAGDGIYTALLAGRSAGSLVAYRITATDNASPSVTSTFPALAPAEECLIRWGDEVPFGTFAHYHLWFTQATGNARQNALDNTYRDSTLVYRNHRVIYNTGFRDKGSPYHGGSGDIAATTPADDPLLGASDRVFASTGNGGSEATGIRSQLAAWYAQQLGIPYLHAHYMRLYFNGSLFRSDIMEDLEQPNHDFAERWFPVAEEGDLYKVSVWFEFNDDNVGFQATGATIQSFTTTGGQYKLARYRWNWQRRSNDGDANNFGQFFDLVSAVNDTSATYVDRVLNLSDMEQWMRVFCYDFAMGNWDAWTYNVGQNMFLYRPAGKRWVLLPWDIDFVFGLGDGTSGTVRGGQDNTMNRAYNNAAFQRMNWRAYQDTVNGPFLPQNFQPQIDARRSVLLKNGVSGLTAPTAITSWINARRSYIQGQINTADAPVFTLITNSGNDFTNATPTVLLTGSAPFAIATIEVNGVPYPLTWASTRLFRFNLPLTQVTNTFVLVGKDRLGNPVPGAQTNITITYFGEVPRVQDHVVINEVHYNPPPSEPNSSFIELFNRSATTPFDLSGFRLQGLSYTFPSGAVIAPGAYWVLVSDRAGFDAKYGGVSVFDVFPGGLDNDGERLALIKPGETPGTDLVVSDLRYWPRLPWPTNAADLGPSLQLIDPAQGAWRVGNWATTATNNANRTTPGRSNAVAQTLAPFPPVWINEVQPYNLSGPVDGAGDRDPWVELYNAGTNAVDLSGLYLTHTYTNLTLWAFPAGTVLDAGAFLVIWTDGEPGETRPGELHTNFRLDPTSGAIALCRLQGSPLTPAVVDYLEYDQLSAGRSFGSYPDGEPRQRQPFVHATPGVANDPEMPPVTVRINEFMAGNTRTLADPADNDYDDWFELYNSDTNEVDLSSYTLTDNLENPTKYRVPAGTRIPAGGFLLVWADEETGQNAPGRDLHVNFKLSLGGEALGLFAPDGSVVDAFDFGQQTNDVSMGRFPDGADLP